MLPPSAYQRTVQRRPTEPVLASVCSKRSILLEREVTVDRCDPVAAQKHRVLSSRIVFIVRAQLMCWFTAATVVGRQASPEHSGAEARQSLLWGLGCAGLSALTQRSRRSGKPAALQDPSHFDTLVGLVSNVAGASQDKPLPGCSENWEMPGCPKAPVRRLNSASCDSCAVLRSRSPSGPADGAKLRSRTATGAAGAEGAFSRLHVHLSSCLEP